MTATRSASAPRHVAPTHGEKLWFPEAGFTKQDVFEFYQRIAPWLLPHLKNRPLTLERLPDGIGANRPHFWQKNAPAYYPSWVPRVNLPTEGGKPVNYVMANDLETLLYLVNQGTITFHVYLSRVNALEIPDYVLFDLDVGQSAFSSAVAVARELHRRLDSQDTPVGVKTSGKSGLHLLTPWGSAGRRDGYDEARAWALEQAQAVCDTLPELATTHRLKASRGKRIYIDTIQNALGHHVVPPYVLRATPGATVSTPLNWKEVNLRLNPGRFTLKTIFHRLEGQKDPMASLI